MPISTSFPLFSLHVLYYWFINMESMANSTTTHSSTRLSNTWFSFLKIHSYLLVLSKNTRWQLTTMLGDILFIHLFYMLTAGGGGGMRELPFLFQPKKHMGKKERWEAIVKTTTEGWLGAAKKKKRGQFWRIGNSPWGLGFWDFKGAERETLSSGLEQLE